VNFYNLNLSSKLSAGLYDDELIDTGDDPSFLARSIFRNSDGRLSWGICRPDVRNLIAIDDWAIFIAFETLPNGEGKYYLKAVCQVESKISMWDVVESNITPYSRYGNLLLSYSNKKYSHHEFLDALGSDIIGHTDWYNRIGQFDWPLIKTLSNFKGKGYRDKYRHFFENTFNSKHFSLTTLKHQWHYQPLNNYIIFGKRSIIIPNGIHIADIKRRHFEVWVNSAVANSLKQLSMRDNEKYLRTTRLGVRGGYPHRHIRKDETDPIIKKAFGQLLAQL
jgi:hypothetical protein